MREVAESILRAQNRWRRLPGIFFLNGRAGFMNGRGLKRLLHGTALGAVVVGLLLSVVARAQVLEGTAKKGVHAQYNQKTGKPEWVATYLSASQIASETELIQELQLACLTCETRWSRRQTRYRPGVFPESCRWKEKVLSAACRMNA